MLKMNYAIGCTDTISGKVGCFGFNTDEYMSADKALQFRAKTPVFPRLDDLFIWAKENKIDLFCYPVTWGEK